MQRTNFPLGINKSVYSKGDIDAVVVWMNGEVTISLLFTQRGAATVSLYVDSPLIGVIPATYRLIFNVGRERERERGVCWMCKAAAAAVYLGYGDNMMGNLQLYWFSTILRAV